MTSVSEVSGSRSGADRFDIQIAARFASSDQFDSNSRSRSNSGSDGIFSRDSREPDSKRGYSPRQSNFLSPPLFTIPATAGTSVSPRCMRPGRRRTFSYPRLAEAGEGADARAGAGAQPTHTTDGAGDDSRFDPGHENRRRRGMEGRRRLPTFCRGLAECARRRYHAVDHTLDFQSVRTTITRFWRRSRVGGCMRSRVEAAAAPQRARLIIGEREEDPQWFSASFTST
jgi:hypothetical protein